MLHGSAWGEERKKARRMLLVAAAAATAGLVQPGRSPVAVDLDPPRAMS